MGVDLRPVTRDNFRGVVQTKVAPDQEDFVARNLYSVAQAHVEPTWTPLAIYADGEPVGFAMYGHDPDADQWWIIRFMIGADHQGKGYGGRALKLLIDLIAERHAAREVYLGYVPGNAVAEGMYARAGFAPTGEVEDGEIVARLRVASDLTGA